MIKLLMDAVDIFSERMKQRLVDKAEDSFTDLNNKEDIANIQLIHRMRDKIEKVRLSYLKKEPFDKKDLTDIANFSMMLDHRKNS